MFLENETREITFGSCIYTICSFSFNTFTLTVSFKLPNSTVKVYIHSKSGQADTKEIANQLEPFSTITFSLFSFTPDWPSAQASNHCQCWCNLGEKERIKGKTLVAEKGKS